MSPEPITITTTYNVPPFDPEDHRKIAAEKMGVDPDALHCVETGPDEAKETQAALFSEDGTLLKGREIAYTRRTTWALRPAPQKAAEPEPPKEPDIPWPAHHGEPRGVRYRGPVTIDGKTAEHNFISTGASFVLASTPEGKAVLAQLDKEHRDHVATMGGAAAVR